MKKEFDFDSVGKRLPYNIKEGTLEKVTTKTLLEVQYRKSNRLLKRVIGVAASFIVICCVTAIYYSATTNNVNSVDEMISSMSDSDLEALVALSDNDVLLNEEF